MPKVQFTKALNRFFNNLQAVEVEASNIKNLVNEVEKKFPGMSDYILENNGALRKHVNIFIGENMIKDRIQLSDKIQTNDEIYIMQALSGG